jgi:hypothetical protein
MSGAARRIRVLTLFCISASIAALISCSSSGSSTSHGTGESPVFTSTPPAAAAQGDAYSYSLTAVDPSGGTVSFALTTGPTGATLSGENVTWTPTASQSRASNAFTVTATTSEGATATQSWTVSPTGVITVNDVNTYWEPSVAVQVAAPNDASLIISAIVPQSDGSLLVLPGEITSPGVISLAGVPAGNYWLALGGGNLLSGFQSAYWTSASTVDAGRDVPGNPLAFTAKNQTNFAFNLSGLDSIASNTNLLFNPEIQIGFGGINDPADTTTFTQTIGTDSDFDWSQSATVFLMQTVPQTIGPSGTQLILNVAGPAATISNPSFTDGTTNNVTATLEADSPVSYDVNVQGSQWLSTFNASGPATATPYASAFSIDLEPFMTTTAPQAIYDFSSLPLAQSVLLPVLGINPILNSLCDEPGFGQSTQLQPAITADTDLGNVTYDDGFSSTWIRAESYCTEATMPVAVPGSSSTVNFALISSETVAASSTPLAPIVGPVQSPTINSASLFTAATLNTTTPTFSWSAPSSGTPYGYRVNVFVFDPGDIYQYTSASSFFTSQTSVTLPPLSAGNTYVFSITALVDGAANVQTSPFRSALPTGYASVVSAPITISSAAALPEIHGDPSVIKRLSQPQPKQPATMEPVVFHNPR